MKTPTKVLLITLLFGGAAFALGPAIWPPSPSVPVPTATQLPFLIVLAVLEAITFGLGVAFVAFGLPLVRRLELGSRARTWTTFIGIAWLMLSWWPHDNMHLQNGLELNGLNVIEYAFHASLMVTGVLLAYIFVSSLRAVQAEPSAQPGGHSPTTRDARPRAF